MPNTPHLCRCGHPASTHQHYRDGSDCGACGPVVCPAWNPPPWWWNLQLLLRNMALEAENSRLRADVTRLARSEHKLRTMIMLMPYNTGHT